MNNQVNTDPQGGESNMPTKKFYCSKCSREIVPVTGRSYKWRHVWADNEIKNWAAVEEAGCFNCAVPKPEGATTQPTPEHRGCVHCGQAPEYHKALPGPHFCARKDRIPFSDGGWRTTVYEPIALSEVQIHEAENADCEGCNREDCKACAYNESHPPPDFVTKAGTKIFIPSAQPVPSAGSKPQAACEVCGGTGVYPSDKMPCGYCVAGSKPQEEGDLTLRQKIEANLKSTGDWRGRTPEEVARHHEATDLSQPVADGGGLRKEVLMEALEAVPLDALARSASPTCPQRHPGGEMKEASSVIASAWSIAFIVMFLVVAASTHDEMSPQAAYLVLFLLAGAVTGTGWLRFRHNAKKSAKDTPTEPKSAPEEQQ